MKPIIIKTEPNTSKSNNPKRIKTFTYLNTMGLSLITHQKRDTENNSSTIFHRFLEMTVRTALFMNYRTKEANPVPLFLRKRKRWDLQFGAQRSNFFQGKYTEALFSLIENETVKARGSSTYVVEVLGEVKVKGMMMKDL